MTENRRNFYRIKHKAHVQYQLFNPEQKSGLENGFQHCNYLSLMNELYALDLESNRLLAQLPDKERSSTALFKVLNKKIDTISRTLVMVESKLPKDEFQTIDISEGGMAFHSADQLTEKQCLTLRLVIVPDYFLLFAEGIVVASESMSDFPAPKRLPHWTRINFTRIEEPQKQLLARHILKVQQQQRRQRTT